MDSFRPLTPRVTREDALAVLGRRRHLPSLGLRPGRLELVYMPFYLFEASIADGAGGERREVLVSVDAVGGRVSRLDHQVRLDPCSSPRPGELFQAVVSPDEALARARRELPWLILPVALKHGRRFPLGALTLRDRLGYPYWVQHVRRGRFRDFQALDGFSARRVGAAGRALLLEAFVGAQTRGKPG